MYQIYNDDGTSYWVFCQFNADRSVLAFPTKHAVTSGLLNLDALWKDRTYVGVYLWLADGKEYEAIIRPLASEEETAELTVATSWQATLASADNDAGPYIYVTITDAGPANNTSSAPSTAAASSKAKRWLRLRFDCDSTAVRLPFDCSSTALRPFYVMAYRTLQVAVV